jgi:DNA-binding NtrC family response regulator
MTGGSTKNRLLVVDDSHDTRELLQRNLSSQGYEVVTAGDVKTALRILESAQVDLVITDLKMPGASGLQLVQHVKEHVKGTAVIMITGYPSVEGAVAAVKSGAEEYLTKPFTQQELFAVVGRVMATRGLPKAGRVQHTRQIANPLGIVGESKAMREVLDAVSRAAATANPVLITGERGTGTPLLARAIHYTSPRAAAPFVVVHCGGVPEEILERQLFGEAAETSAAGTESRAGFLLLAGDGTLFLHDISELPYGIQARLVRALEENAFRAVGSTRAHTIAFRLIAASHRDLRPLVGRGLFRDDLFLRLSATTIAVPAVRERGNDALLLAEHFLRRFASELGRPVPSFSPRAVEAVTRYSWPGNVAELQNCIQQLVSTTSTGIIDVSALPEPMRYWLRATPGVNRSLAEVEADYIRNVLASVGGNKTRAAEILGINRKTLREKLGALRSRTAAI